MRGVSVQIMGQNLVVASDEGDDWAKALAATVDAKIEDIRASSQSVNSVKLVILAALNIAEDLEHLRRDHQKMLDRIETLSQRLADAVES
jgi:cell division protein ZapA (FtsZ GTPase activity inhibitor)